MELRPHQEKALLLSRDSMRRNLKRPIIAAPTAFGKTILAGQMMKNCQDAGKVGWFFCDRVQLIKQTIEQFSKMGIDFGVRQADHELHNPKATIQIASIQTVAAMVNKHKRRLPEFDLAIVDECHTQYDVIQQIQDTYNNIQIIGLTATPYSKGLGLRYNNLIVPITQRELLDLGYLCPVRYYGGEHIDMSKIKSVNPNTYKTADIERETDANSDKLAGCIIDNWFKYGENAQTIAFSPTQNLSKNLVERFNAAGISAEHIDCNFSQEDREALFEAHDNGEFKVLSCAQLLNTGYDAPQVRCIVDCYPVKSITTYVQRVGRLMRTCEGKEYAIYLDHASNFDQFGFAEDIVPEYLDDGTTTHNESDLVKKEKKEPKKRECPQCMQMMVGIACKACGYEVPVAEQIEDDGKLLVEREAQEGKKANQTDSRETKEQFLSELEWYAESKNYKKGWAGNKYRAKYGVWPNKTDSHPVSGITKITSNWLKHERIKYARGRKGGYK